VVDLPQMLVHSSWTIHNRCGQADPAFGSVPDEGFGFFRPGETDLLPNGGFDIALNANSFMEMERAQRDGYLELIQRVLRPGGLFWNVNRAKPATPQRDGSTYDNNPLLYPYDPRARVLLWDQDEFQGEVRGRPGKLAGLALVRAELAP
jgi:SAM-dependent methyltransferase